MEALFTSTWYLDNGAIYHITSYATNFQHSTPYQGSDQLHLGNDQGLPILSFGHSHLDTNQRTLHL